MMTFGQLIFMWAIIGLLSALFAKERGRDPYAWFFIGMLGGIFALIALFLLPTLKPQDTTVIDVKAERLPPQHTFGDHDWFYLDSTRNNVGPLPFYEMQNLFEEGKIGATTLIWNQNETEWKKVEAFPGLLEALRKN